MKLSRRFWLLAAIGLCFLPACAKSNKVKVAVVSNNPADFWTIAEAGAMKAGKDFDVDVIFRKPEKGEVGVQMEAVEALLKQGISGIAVSVINPEEQTNDLKRIAGKVKLLTMDNDAANSNRICYVGTDNYEAGRAVGRLVKEAMPEGGTVAVFVGQITPINARQRFNGVIDELADVKRGTPDSDRPKGPKYGKYTLHGNDVRTDGANETVAQQNASDVLASLEKQIKDQGEKVCMVGLWAYNPPAILEAARSKGLVGKIKIVGFDEDRLTLEGIDKGEIYATVVQDPYNFGYKSVEILAALAKGDNSKVTKDAIDYRIIVKEAGTDPETKKPRLAAKKFQEDLNALLNSARK